jgi:hypothetical protein
MVKLGPGPAAIEDPAHTTMLTGRAVAVWPARVDGTPVAPPYTKLAPEAGHVPEVNELVILNASGADPWLSIQKK